MKNINILLAGFGGQGILFAGKVMAYTGLVDGRKVSWLPSYGPEMRGGTANCSVCISEEEIGSPLVLAPELLLVMNLPSYDKFIGSVAKGGIAVVDSSLIDKKCIRDDISVHYVPATQLAADNDLKGLANIIMIGKALAAAGFASLDTVKTAIEKCVPASKKHLLESNFKAIDIGMNS